MRVLHVLDHSLPLHSGYTFRTQAILAGQRELGWEPVPVTGPKQQSGTALSADVDGWRFYRTPAANGPASGWPVAGEFALMRALERRLDRLIAAVRPEIVHAHSPVLNGLPALRSAHRAGLPMVYEVRAFWEDAAVEHGTCRPNGPRYQATRALESRVLRRADSVTAICRGLCDAIHARGVPAGRITEIPNAVDAHRFSVDTAVDTTLERQLGLDGEFVIGFAGSFYRYEGLDYLIHAMARPEIRARRIVLLLIGGGPEDDRLRALVDQLGVAGRVRLTGRIAHEDMARYYALFDLLVYPRLRHRLTELVTPLKPLEAMASGKLVAASDVGGHRELIRSGGNGFLFEPGSVPALVHAVLTIAGMAETEKQAMRQRGRLFVESERTWSQSVARYQTVYDRLLGQDFVSGGRP